MSDINELFSRDPMKLTDENIDQIIEEMRKKRHLFEAGGAKPKAAKPKHPELAGLDLDFKL